METENLLIQIDANKKVKLIDFFFNFFLQKDIKKWK